MNNIPPEKLPLLSVVMVVRNAAATVAHALDSLVAQHYPRLELIVWDGVSTDGTLEILKRYSHIITTLKSERDKNSPDGCNHAVPLATGDFVGFLYADDEYQPGFLWAVTDAILRAPDTDVVSGGTMYFTENRKGRKIISGYYAHESQLALTLDKALSELPTFVLSRFFRRGLFGPYDTNLLYANDRDVVARLALKKYKNVIIPHAFYSFVMHDDSLSSNPDHFTRIVEEHCMIAEALLTRENLTPEERKIVEHWRLRNLVFGFWKALARLEFKQALTFKKEGFALGGILFCLLCIYLLAKKLIKRIGLMLSNGIDRGDI